MAGKELAAMTREPGDLPSPATWDRSGRGAPGKLIGW